MSPYQKRLVIGGIILLLVVGVIFAFGIRRSDERFEGTLTLWSFESATAWKDIITSFEGEYPGIEVQYAQKNERTYETDLLNALAAGQGPDVFVIHHTWIAKHGDKLAPAPSELMNPTHFRTEFVDVASEDLVGGGGVIGGVPMYVDSLALYYNTNLFNAHGVVSAPRTWEAFNDVVKRTTIVAEDGTILQAGATLGTQNNVEHADDIVETLMLQNGARMADTENNRARFADETRTPQGDASFSPGENALTYYTNFADPAKEAYTWSRREGDAKTTFLNGRAAMYVGYASELSEMRESGLPFDVAPLPQVVDRTQNPSYTDVVLARYWAGAVSIASPKQFAAWTFWTFAASRNAQFNYLSHTGLPTSRRDLIELQVGHDRQLGVFARQALIADSWPQFDYAAVRDIFKKMIEDVTLGRAVSREAVSQAEDRVTELLQATR